MMTLNELRAEVNAGAIDTVLLALVDMQGRMQGKRLTAPYFLDTVAEDRAEACNYLLAVDVEMETVSGYEMSSWERGYGDFELWPDLDTLRPVPWLPGTALCLADINWSEGHPVPASPRQILRRQLDRLAERGWGALAATELEFLLFRDTYEEAWHKGYKDLEPANLYNVDYSLLGTSKVEPLIRRIRNEMGGAGLVVENSKGECNFGQHEINFLYADALTTADQHAIYKNGAKEIAAQEGMAISFMAKFNEHEGSSCHVHLSLDGGVFAHDESVFDAFLGGQLACLRELALFFAPNVNSYKRYQPGSFAPTAVAWGRDNRTCALRVVGHGDALRIENRAAGRRRQPLPDPGRDDRRGAARGRRGAGGRAGLRGQRLRSGQAAGPGDARGGPRALRRQRDGPRGVRRRRRRPLPQHGRRRARRLPRGGDRLGAHAGVRAPVSRPPVIGLVGALERASWSVWDLEAVLSPRNYLDAVVRAGGVPLVCHRSRGSTCAAVLERLDGLVLAGGADVDPASYGAEPDPETVGSVPERDRASRPTSSSWRWSATSRCSGSAAACRCSTWPAAAR